MATMTARMPQPMATMGSGLRGFFFLGGPRRTPQRPAPDRQEPRPASRPRDNPYRTRRPAARRTPLRAAAPSQAAAPSRAAVAARRLRALAHELAEKTTGLGGRGAARLGRWRRRPAWPPRSSARSAPQEHRRARIRRRPGAPAACREGVAVGWRRGPRRWAAEARAVWRRCGGGGGAWSLRRRRRLRRRRLSRAPGAQAPEPPH